MIYDSDLVDLLGDLKPAPWAGSVFRHMFGDHPPDKENTLGARWNPPGVPAIYASLEFETAKAEADYRIALQPLRPSATRRIHVIQVRLENVIDLRDWSALTTLGVDQGSFESIEPGRCKEVGGAAAELLHVDGLLVPSARHGGANLVIYPTNQAPSYEFHVLTHHVIEDSEGTP